MYIYSIIYIYIYTLLASFTKFSRIFQVTNAKHPKKEKTKRNNTSNFPKVTRLSLTTFSRRVKT